MLHLINIELAKISHRNNKSRLWSKIQFLLCDCLLLSFSLALVASSNNSNRPAQMLVEGRSFIYLARHGQLIVAKVPYPRRPKLLINSRRENMVSMTGDLPEQ